MSKKTGILAGISTVLPFTLPFTAPMLAQSIGEDLADTPDTPEIQPDPEAARVSENESRRMRNAAAGIGATLLTRTGRGTTGSSSPGGTNSSGSMGTTLG